MPLSNINYKTKELLDLLQEKNILKISLQEEQLLTGLLRVPFNEHFQRNVNLFKEILKHAHYAQSASLLFSGDFVWHTQANDLWPMTVFEQLTLKNIDYTLLFSPNTMRLVRFLATPAQFYEGPEGDSSVCLKYIGCVTKERMHQIYLSKVKLVDYRWENEILTIYSHSALSHDALIEIARILEVPLNINTRVTFEACLAQINQKFLSLILHYNQDPQCRVQLNSLVAHAFFSKPPEKELTVMEDFSLRFKIYSTQFCVQSLEKQSAMIKASQLPSLIVQRVYDQAVFYQQDLLPIFLNIDLPARVFKNLTRVMIEREDFELGHKFAQRIKAPETQLQPDLTPPCLKSIKINFRDYLQRYGVAEVLPLKTIRNAVVYYQKKHQLQAVVSQSDDETVVSLKAENLLSTVSKLREYLHIQDFTSLYQNIKYTERYVSYDAARASFLINVSNALQHHFPKLTISESLLELQRIPNTTLQATLFPLFNDYVKQLTLTLMDCTGYWACTSEKVVQEAIEREKANPSLGTSWAYFFRKNKIGDPNDNGHVDLLVMHQGDLIQPVPYLLTEEAFKIQNISCPVYWFDTKFWLNAYMGVQADYYSCGIMSLLVFKVLLKNNAEALRERSLCFTYMDPEYNFRHVFIPPPDMLLYSQSTGYVQAMVEFIGSSKLDSALNNMVKQLTTVMSKATSQTQEKYKPSLNGAQNTLNQLDNFKRRWFEAYEKISAHRKRKLTSEGKMLDLGIFGRKFERINAEGKLDPAWVGDLVAELEDIPLTKREQAPLRRERS